MRALPSISIKFNFSNFLFTGKLSCILVAGLLKMLVEGLLKMLVEVHPIKRIS
jgi:hypothetical protein